MHREDNSRFLLYIEPKHEQKSNDPINDGVTKAVEISFSRSISGTADYSDKHSNGNFREGGSWRGWHTSDCGECSGSRDYLLENGMITNDLCVFYLQYYRDAIPEIEMKKVIELCDFINNLK